MTMSLVIPISFVNYVSKFKIHKEIPRSLLVNPSLKQNKGKSRKEIVGIC